MVRPGNALKDIRVSVKSSKPSIRQARINSVDPGRPSGIVEGSAGLVYFIKGVVPLEVVLPMLRLRVASSSPGKGGPVEMKYVSPFCTQLKSPIRTL